MSALTYKFRADLWRHKGRSLLAVASIAIGLFGVGTIFGMIDLLLAKMDAAHRLSQPSHINILLRNAADSALLEQIAALPDIAGVEGLNPVAVRFRPTPDAAWQSGSLIVRTDYARQLYDRSALVAGDWPVSGKLAIENLSAQNTGLGLGGNVQLQTERGELSFPLDGIIRHPFVKPPKFGGQTVFFGSATEAERFGIDPHRFRQLLVQIRQPYSEDKARVAALQIRALLAERGIAANATLFQDPDRHWGRPFLAGINGVLEIMALAALALSASLIVNTVSAHLTQQTDQIGVMKAVGGGSLAIAVLYLSETLLLALVAILFAAPPAALAAHLASCRLLAIFNIDCGGFELPYRALSYLVAGGLLVPLLAAAGPVWRGTTMTVRAAIASYGLAADFGTYRLDVWLQGLAGRWLPTVYAAALGNLFRRKTRLLLTQIVLVVAGIAFLSLMSLIASVNLTLDNEMARSRYSLKLGFASDQPKQMLQEAIKAADPAYAVETWRRLPLELGRDQGVFRQKGSLGLQLLALPAGSAFYRPRIESGRWLQADDAGRDVLVMNAETAALNGIKTGDMVEAAIGRYRQTWQVVGLYRWLAGSQYAVEPVYAPLETIEKAVGGGFASLALVATPAGTREDEANRLQRLGELLQKRGAVADVYNTQGLLEQRDFSRNQFRPVIGALSGLAVMLAAVGGIGLSGTLAIGVLQRSREIGVLRAIGAPSPTLSRLFMLEGLFHGILAWLVSVPLAYRAGAPLAKRLGETMLGLSLDYRFDIAAAGYWLGLILVLAAAASYFPARKAAKMAIQDCLSH
ncbi:FtsX-like permease family protein [Methylomonas sp. SURF-1]|uniref:FtsX-like permease family protein n=1 Tax=Methylomonas aurea TaxID=2952224 RepID=A0ABT1UHU2_9GAMM|nr:FtsX family ABC transporter permease [Methylomonas sp. SURF-1]MCQ8181794.1 FtsX-like permease family protein [Methylomonas sp. SURF-1]